MNRGYGANQKTCYRHALAAGGDIIIMIHPDYQYTPRLIPAMAALVASGVYPCVLASRILGGGALRGGMPWWKYISNRFLTFIENVFLGTKLSEYHTGYRASTVETLIGQARSTADATQRLGLYRQVEQQVLGDMAASPIGFFRNHYAATGRVRGFYADALGGFEVARLSLSPA